MGRKLSAYNLHMKRELKGKMKGKTKAQRKAIFKAAARAWKGKSKPRSKPKSGGSRRSSSTTRRSNTTMGRKGGFNTQKLFKVIRLAALVAPAATVVMESGLTKAGMERLIQRYTGFDPRDGRFHFEYLVQGLGPYVAASAVTYGIPKLMGLIRGF